VDDWKQAAAWLATPNSFGGGIWQAGQGPAADADGNVYLITGNGGYLNDPVKTDFNGTTDFAECIARLSYQVKPGGAALTLTDWFIPFRGDFPRPIQVRLSHPDREAVVRYTLDGSAPVPSSAVYVDALRLTTSTTVRARTFETGHTQSIVVQETFILEP